MKEKEWILEWFQNNSDAKRSELKKGFDENYFLKGWIDSLKFINLITDAEEKFEITFSKDEFQNREFSTINGLTKIIEKKCQ